MKDWIIVKSRSGFHPEHGYPIGEILCRNIEDIERAIKDSGMNDPVLISYEEWNKQK